MYTRHSGSIWFITSHFGPSLFFKYIASSNPKSIYVVVYWIWGEWQKGKDCRKTQFCNFSLNDSLTRRLEVTRYKFSYFSFFSKVYTKRFKVRSTNKTKNIWHNEPLRCHFMPLWLCLCCFLDLNFYCLFLPNSNLSLFQLNGLKSFTSSYKKSSLDAQSWGRYLLFLFLPWLTYFKVFYHFCMEIIPTRLSTFKRGAVIYPFPSTPVLYTVCSVNADGIRVMVKHLYSVW